MKNLYRTIDSDRRKDKKWEKNNKHYIITGIILFFLSVPVLGTILYSLSSSWGATIFPDGFTLKWFAALFADTRFIASLQRSFAIGIVSLFREYVCDNSINSNISILFSKSFKSYRVYFSSAFYGSCSCACSWAFKCLFWSKFKNFGVPLNNNRSIFFSGISFILQE